MKTGLLLTLILIMTATSCHQSSKKKQGLLKTINPYQENASAIVSMAAFDIYNQKTCDGYGFYVAPDLIITNLNWFQGAYRLKFASMEGRASEPIPGYVAYDVNKNLALLRVSKRNQKFIKISASSPYDTVYQVLLHDSQLLSQRSAVRDSAGWQWVATSLSAGKPLFAPNHQLAGMAQMIDKQIRLLPTDSLRAFIDSRSGDINSIYDLRLKNNREYPSHKNIEGFNIVTDMGTIRIRLDNKTPEYRDNFIRLVTDRFYDSLLVHRVINSFLIQMGAADSKFAGRDDVVGWQGPGYTLPMQISPNLIHRRGAIASSKLPADRNPNNRSDGSQFYIISGRVYTSAELDELEKQGHKPFSDYQRKIYTSIGGAPHLDGDYTVFGEVVSGMEIVDRISKVAVYNTDRPERDIRVKRIEAVMR